MVVNDGCIWEEECEVMLVNSSCEVNIFWVHEESFVKKSHSLQSSCSHEHKASAEVGDIHDMVIP